ncbi:MAG: SIS domain-containing protein [Treponema sp.]|jgi:glucosamine 6-phosphate synthetase-like amidotransferase/phosphosugar isomerase protein|nr:SIS domain-containing protein [Treponema sp.]
MSGKKREASIFFEEIQMSDKVIRENTATYPVIWDQFKHFFESNKFEKIIIVGCGDSLYAPQAAKFALMNNTGVSVDVFEAHEFCMYEADYMPANSLVIVSSNSGAAARTVECSYVAQKKGAQVLAVTSRPQSRLAKSCKQVMNFPAQRLGHVPGNVSFLSLLCVFYTLSARLGRWNGRLTDEGEKAVYAEMNNIADSVRRFLEEGALQVKLLAEKLSSKKKFYFLGAGPSFPMAEFGAAKVMETWGIDGIPQQLEEFAHEQYFVSNLDRNNDTFVISPYGRCTARAREIVKELGFLETGNIVITTPPPGGVPGFENAGELITLPGVMDEYYSPLAMGVVLSLFSYYYAMANDQMTMHFREEAQEPEHYSTIHFSRFSPFVAEFDIPEPDDATKLQFIKGH